MSLTRGDGGSDFTLRSAHFSLHLPSAENEIIAFLYAWRSRPLAHLSLFFLAPSQLFHMFRGLLFGRNYTRNVCATSCLPADLLCRVTLAGGRGWRAREKCIYYETRDEPRGYKWWIAKKSHETIINRTRERARRKVPLSVPFVRYVLLLVKLVRLMLNDLCTAVRDSLTTALRISLSI